MAWFSPSVWAGVALFGVSVVLFVIGGVLRGRSKPAEEKTKNVGTGEQTAGELTATGPEPAKASGKKQKKQPKKQAADPDAGEFDEIEEILKRHGIN